VNIDVWQLQYEMDDDDLADLPETGWEIEAVDRDDDYDDGYRYTIVHTRHDDWQFEVSSSVLKKRKPIRKGRMFKEFSKKFGKKFKESFDTYDEFEALGDELKAKYKRCKYAEAELYVDDDGSYTIAVRIDTDHKDESKEMNRFLTQQSRKHHWRLEKEPDIYDPVRERRVDEFFLYVV